MSTRDHLDARASESAHPDFAGVVLGCVGQRVPSVLGMQRGVGCADLVQQDMDLVAGDAPPPFAAGARGPNDSSNPQRGQGVRSCVGRHLDRFGEVRDADTRRVVHGQQDPEPIGVRQRLEQLRPVLDDVRFGGARGSWWRFGMPMTRVVDLFARLGGCRRVVVGSSCHQPSVTSRTAKTVTNPPPDRCRTCPIGPVTPSISRGEVADYRNV